MYKGNVERIVIVWANSDVTHDLATIQSMPCVWRFKHYIFCFYKFYNIMYIHLIQMAWSLLKYICACISFRVLTHINKWIDSHAPTNQWSEIERVVVEMAPSIHLLTSSYIYCGCPCYNTTKKCKSSCPTTNISHVIYSTLNNLVRSFSTKKKIEPYLKVKAHICHCTLVYNCYN